MSRPTGGYPRWATSGATVTEPTSAKKDVGWKTSEKPPGFFFNWLLNTIYLWISYFDERLIRPKTTADGLPLFTYQDGNGQTRSFVSPNGYLLGPTMHVHESWSGAVAGSGSGGEEFAQWRYDGDQTSGTGVSSINRAAGASPLGSSYPLNVERLTCLAGNVVGNYVLLRSFVASFLASASVSAEMLVDIGVSNDNATSNRTTAAWGFSTDLSNPETFAHPSVLVIADRSIGLNWILYTSDGAASTITDTFIPIAADNMVSIKLELLGANSDYGRCAKLVIGGTPFTVTTTLPPVDTALFHGFCLKRTTAGGTPVDIFSFTGPFQLNINNGLLGIV